MECRKVYVDVDVSILKNGKVYPRRLRYEDGTVFKIERLLDTCRSASTKVGGVGIRYTVMIHATFAPVRIGSSWECIQMTE